MAAGLSKANRAACAGNTECCLSAMKYRNKVSAGTGKMFACEHENIHPDFNVPRQKETGG